jgi:hypothetical protein
MKKLFFPVAALLVVSVATAQNPDRERHDRNNFPYLPQKGDIATGVDLVGMARFLGNTMSEKVEGEAVVPFQGDFFAKYFITDNIALRAHIGLGVANGTRRVSVTDDVKYALDKLSVAQVVDEEKSKGNAFGFGAGIEFRKGKRRVQGYVGAELFFVSGSKKFDYTYGNRMSEDNKNPSTGLGSYHPGYYYSGRYLDRSSSFRSGGAALFAGVDYFISHGVSLGFEFGLAGVSSTSNPNKITYERWYENSEWDEPHIDTYQKITEERPGQNSFAITPSGRANLMFYF